MMLAKTRMFHRYIAVGVLSVIIGAAGVESALSQVQPLQNPSDSRMLQFTAAGHALGFQQRGVYVAAGSHMLRESFVGTRGVTPLADRLPEARGRTQSLEKVCYPDLWPGITLTYDRPPGGIVRSTYHIEPGADPKKIALRYNVPVSLDAAGDLVFEFDAGTMAAGAPVAWQKIGNERVPVKVAFALDDSQSTVRFSLGAYNPDLPLFIDPTLTWHTFMGSSSWDDGHAIAVDGSGNVYVAGVSNDAWGSPVNPHAGGADAFVAKLAGSGERLWHTFLGSSGSDWGWGIAVDGSGNVYVAGYSDAGWGSPVNGHAGDYDAFAAKLNASGALQWHTFMGSSGADWGWGIAADGSGAVYVAGYSDAGWGIPVNAHAGGDDAFAAKLNASGVLQWHTFMGSTGTDNGLAVAVDGSGNVYVAGHSDAGWGIPVNAHAGNYDVFAAKLNTSGALQWHTFMGGSNNDYGRAIAVDGRGNVFVAGESYGTWGNPVNPMAGAPDACAAELDGSGVLQWHTFMGSTGADHGYGIAVNGGIFVAGRSYSDWGNPVNAYAGNRDALVALISGGAVAPVLPLLLDSSD